MSPELHASVAPTPHVNVTAMAEIVKELLDGNASQQQNAAWLQQRSRAAMLGEHERAALEALRVQMYERGGTMRDEVILGWWG